MYTSGVDVVDAKLWSCGFGSVCACIRTYVRACVGCLDLSKPGIQDLSHGCMCVLCANQSALMGVERNCKFCLIDAAYDGLHLQLHGRGVSLGGPRIQVPMRRGV